VSCEDKRIISGTAERGREKEKERERERERESERERERESARRIIFFVYISMNIAMIIKRYRIFPFGLIHYIAII